MLCWYESTKTEQWFAPPSLHLPHSSAGIWSGAFMRTIQKHRNKYWISKYFWDILRRNRISRYATCTKKRFVLAKKKEKKKEEEEKTGIKTFSRAGMNSPCCFSQDSERRGGREKQREKSKGELLLGTSWKLWTYSISDLRVDNLS